MKYPQTSMRILEPKDLKQFNSSELRFMRNELYAKYGYIFKSKDLSLHFSDLDWYQPKYKYDHEVYTLFSDIEKENIQTIQMFESTLSN